MKSENTTLYFREGSSDKVYQACLEQENGGLPRAAEISGFSGSIASHLIPYSPYSPYRYVFHE